MGEYYTRSKTFVRLLTKYYKLMKGIFVTFSLTQPDSNIIFSCVVCFLTTHISKSCCSLQHQSLSIILYSPLMTERGLGAKRLSCSSDELLQWLLITKRSKLVALTLVEFILELNPVETEGMQEALHHVHGHQHTNCEGNPHKVTDPDSEESTANWVSVKGRHDSVF